MTLSDPSFHVRTAAHVSYVQHEDDAFTAEQVRLQAAMTEAHERRKRNHREAAEQLAATAHELEAQLAADAKAALWPLAAAFSQSAPAVKDGKLDPTWKTPREAAAAIADAWRALDARCREETGEELSYKHLAVAMAAAQGYAERLGARGFFVFDGLSPAAVTACNAVAHVVGGTIGGMPVPLGGPVEIEEALRALERDLARSHRNFPASPARLEAMMSRASERAMRATLEDFDAPRETEAGAATIRANAAAQNALDRRVSQDRSTHEQTPKFFAEKMAGDFR